MSVQTLKWTIPWTPSQRRSASFLQSRQRFPPNRDSLLGLLRSVSTGLILEAVMQQHALESLQPPVTSMHELQYAHAQICLQQAEQVAAMSLAAKQPPPVIATVPPPTATVHPSLSTVGGVPDLVTSLFTAVGFSKNSAGDWTKSSAVSPGSVSPRATVGPCQAFPMGHDPSTGGTHAYGKHVRRDSVKVLEELCPSGIPRNCLEALGETLPDVAPIPGT